MLKGWSSYKPSPKLSMPPIKPVAALWVQDDYMPNSAYSVFDTETTYVRGGPCLALAGCHRAGDEVILDSLWLFDVPGAEAARDKIRAGQLYAVFSYACPITGGSSRYPRALYLADAHPDSRGQPLQFEGV